MLGRLQAMGKAVKVTEDADGCLSGSCKAARKAKPACGSGGRCADWAVKAGFRIAANALSGYEFVRFLGLVARVRRLRRDPGDSS